MTMNVILIYCFRIKLLWVAPAAFRHCRRVLKHLISIEWLGFLIRCCGQLLWRLDVFLRDVIDNALQYLLLNSLRPLGFIPSTTNAK
jgi:hypothetical protein